MVRTARRLLDDFIKCSCVIESAAKLPPFPPEVYYYLLVLEDRRFYQHPGVDALSILRAVVRYAQGRHGGGASTIGQQFVRVVTNRRARTLTRKLREIFLSIALTVRYGRQGVLHAYAHIAYLGEGLSGLSEASVFLWGAQIEDLNDQQVATLVAALKYPIPSTITSGWRNKVIARSEYGRRRAQERGWVKGKRYFGPSISSNRERSKP